MSEPKPDPCPKCRRGDKLIIWRLSMKEGKAADTYIIVSHVECKRCKLKMTKDEAEITGTAQQAHDALLAAVNELGGGTLRTEGTRH
jgi:Zn ribbon nucleic-acid-binding protein